MAQNLGALTVHLYADTNKFHSAFTKAYEATNKFAEQTEKATKSSGIFAQSLKSLGSAVGSLNVIASTTSRILTGVFDAAAEGARNAAAQQFFENAGKSIDQFRSATGGLISDAELMKKANLADSMGISQDVFQRLANVAQASALKTGQSFEYMFNSIIVGTARSSRLLLDNLGIIVSVAEANRKYAEAHKAAGQSVDSFVASMDAEQKQIAFANEVMIQSQGTLDEFAKLGETAAAKFDRFEATIGNFKDALKGLATETVGSTIPALTALVQTLSTVIESMKGVEFNWKRIIAAGVLLGPVGAGAEISNQLSKGPNSAQAKTDNQFGKQQDLEIAMEKLQRSNASFGSMWQNEVLQKVADYGATQMQQLRSIDPVFADLIANVRAAALALGKLPQATPTATTKTAEDKKAAGSGSGKDHSMDYPYGFIEKLAKKREEIEEKLAQGAIDAKSREAEHYLKFNQDLKDARLARKKAEMDLIDQRIANEQAAADAILEARKKIEEQLAARDAQIGSTVGSIASGGGIAGPIMTAVAPMVGAAIGGPLGAIVGALMPILGAVVDGLGPVVRLIESLTNGIQLLVKNGLQEFLTILNPITEALQPLLAVLGLLVGSILRVFVGPLKLIFQAAMFVVVALTALMAVLAPINEIFWSLWVILGDLVLGLFGMDTTDILYAFTNAIQQAGKWLIETAISFNNAIVKFMRNTLGQKAFGKILSKEDFIVMSDEENTDAVKENTKAIRDFSREFRNLPQGYRIESATYSSTRTVPRPGRIGADLSSTLASAPSANDLVRWRN